MTLAVLPSHPKTVAEIIRETTLGSIQHLLAAKGRPVYRDLKRMCDRVSESYRDRVVLELLQNAHDAHNPERSDGRIRLWLDEASGSTPFGTLYVANDGRCFSRHNFDALCSPTQTSKTVNDAIGNKGVGFLSVFQVCHHPEIYSRLPESQSDYFDGYCFQFAGPEALRTFLDSEGLVQHVDHIVANMPQLYLACPLGTTSPVIRQLAADGYVTVVALPLKSAEARDSVRTQLKALTGGETVVQLFLGRIAELRVQFGDTDLVLRRDSRLLLKRERFSLWQVRCGGQAFVVARKTICHAELLKVIMRDVEAERLPESWLEWEGDGVVSLAVAAEGEPINGRLYNFLPMGAAAKAPLAAHLDAPFYATIERLRLQDGIKLNDFLMEASRQLAIEAATTAVEYLPREMARSAALDFLLWLGPTQDFVVNSVLESKARLFPVLAGGSRGWSSLDELRLWTGDDFLTPAFVARCTAFAIVDASVGASRLKRLEAFVQKRDLLKLSSEERGDLTEAVAKDLLRHNRSTAVWNKFYASLAILFKDDPASLRARDILLTTRNDLVPTDAPEDSQSRKRSGKRLSAAFLPPLRGSAPDAAASIADLPGAVQRRISYLHADLDCARNGASPARQFLLTNGLVREHESRGILRMIVGVMADPGSARDPDKVMWGALAAIKKTVLSEGVPSAVVRDMAIRVPTHRGWIRATEAFFGSWAGTHGSDLERLFEAAKGISEELDELSGNLLLPYGDWEIGSQSRDEWVRFLKVAGVSDHLRPTSVLQGQPVRADGSRLADALANRNTGIGEGQRSAWLKLMREEAQLPNPLTPYTARDAFRLPGQTDHEALAPVVGKLYAIQVVRILEEAPDLMEMTVFRPSAHHSGATHKREWPSPLGTFVRTAAWMPLSAGGTAMLADTWMPGFDGNPPPGLPMVHPDLRGLILANVKAKAVLYAAGMPEFGTSRSAWAFLLKAPALIPGANPAQAERILSASQDAWRSARLDQSLPVGMVLIGRRASKVATIMPPTDNDRVVIADSDDRQIVSAIARSSADAFIFEPPIARASQIADYLDSHLPGRFQRASTTRADYEIEGTPFTFNATDPLINDAVSIDLRSVLILTLRYRSTAFEGDVSDAIDRLSRLRLRWIGSLALRLEYDAQPLLNFDHRAVLARSAEGDTILAPAVVRGSAAELTALAEAIGEALGGRKSIGEPLLAVAALLSARREQPTPEAIAAALDVALEEVRAIINDSLTSIAEVMRIARPITALWGSEAAAEALAPGGSLLTEEDLIETIERVAPALPISGAELVMRCRHTGSVEAIAVGLEVDLAALNEVLSSLGEPYCIIDRSDLHRETEAAFLARKEAMIRESFRAAYRGEFDARGDLAPYVAVRHERPALIPVDFGVTRMSVSQADLDGLLDEWLQARHALSLTDIPTGKAALDAVREANLKLCRSMVPEARIAILLRLEAKSPFYGRWRNAVAAEAAVVSAATAGGWADFDRLDETGVLAWWTRAGLWPDCLGSSLSTATQTITAEQRAELRERDRTDQIKATARKREVPYAGGTFTVGETSYGIIADKIAEWVNQNTAMLATSIRSAKGTAPTLRSRATSNSSSGGRNQTTPTKRPSDDERDLIGFFGEVIAYHWLRARFGSRRIIDESCWKSMYRCRVFGGEGNDSLGYDFEVTSGKARWFFEVKATSGGRTGAPHMIEMGSTEILQAEACRAETRTHYRILHVTNALHPAQARLTVLPNPRSVEGLAFYSEQSTAGVRLRFSLSE
jgi:hypothetical protein